eukprot:7339507-Prymnesium_polylepis.2
MLLTVSGLGRSGGKNAEGADRLPPKKRGVPVNCRLPSHTPTVCAIVAGLSTYELTRSQTPCRSPRASSLNVPVKPVRDGSERILFRTAAPSCTLMPAASVLLSAKANERGLGCAPDFLPRLLSSHCRRAGTSLPHSVELSSHESEVLSRGGFAALRQADCQDAVRRCRTQTLARQEVAVDEDVWVGGESDDNDARIPPLQGAQCEGEVIAEVCRSVLGWLSTNDGIHLNTRRRGRALQLLLDAATVTRGVVQQRYFPPGVVPTHVHDGRRLLTVLAHNTAEVRVPG